MDRAKVFISGRSQAVRLPKAYRFSGSEVSIRREGDAIILEPLRPLRWPSRFFDEVRIDDDTFERSPQPPLPPSTDLV